MTSLGTAVGVEVSGCVVLGMNHGSAPIFTRMERIRKGCSKMAVFREVMTTVAMLGFMLLGMPVGMLALLDRKERKQ